MSSLNTFRTSDGLNINYAVDDFSPPWKPSSTVVMLHAAMGSLERFYAWVPPVAQKYRVVRWDMRGHGNSDEPQEDLELSIGRLSKDLVEMLDHLELDDAHIVGSSTGGIIAMYAAIQYPERIRSIASYAAIPGLQQSTDHNDYNDWNHGLVKEGVRNFLRRTVKQRFHVDQVEPGFVDWFIENSARNDPLFLARFVRMMTSFDFSDQLPQIRCPMLAVVPSGDPVHSMENYETVKAVPGLRDFIVYENMPHNITDAVPQRCIKDLMPFLDSL
ncbi:MAG: alpha/beta hydrolase [Candidimonas sp.]|jgi:3-oxoadipate enol-lactonase